MTTFGSLGFTLSFANTEKEREFLNKVGYCTFVFEVNDWCALTQGAVRITDRFLEKQDSAIELLSELQTREQRGRQFILKRVKSLCSPILRFPLLPHSLNHSPRLSVFLAAMRWRKQTSLFCLLFLLAVLLFAFAQIDCASLLPRFPPSFDFQIAVSEDNGSPRTINNRLELPASAPFTALPSERKERGDGIRDLSSPSSPNEPNLSRQPFPSIAQRVEGADRERRALPACSVHNGGSSALKKG